MIRWSAARTCARAARQRALADRAAHEASDPRTVWRRECYRCGGTDGLRWEVFDVDGIPTKAMMCRECRQT
jgi:hypothetical protein